MISILLMGFLEIYFIIHEYLKLIENMKLVINSINLKYFTNYGVYLIRENTLFSTDNFITEGVYNIPDNDYFIYVDKINSLAKQIFSECNFILESIISSNLDFCNKTNYILNEMPYI